MAETTTIRERPILFSGRMVKAILDGLKSQTRRVIKSLVGQSACNVKWDGETLQRYGAGGVWLTVRCPYGEVGDRLWVRETWAPARNGDTGERIAIYRQSWESNGNPDGPNYDKHWKGWRPSIFMPRWASRLTLEITDVRIERLQDISEATAVAEGFGVLKTDGWYGKEVVATTAVDNFETLWKQLNDKRPGCSWKENPWVLAISFKRVPNA